jgi:hypothetical protein
MTASASWSFREGDRVWVRSKKLYGRKGELVGHSEAGWTVRLDKPPRRTPSEIIVAERDLVPSPPPDEWLLPGRRVMVIGGLRYSGILDGATGTLVRRTRLPSNGLRAWIVELDGNTSDLRTFAQLRRTRIAEFALAPVPEGPPADA